MVDETKGEASASLRPLTKDDFKTRWLDVPVRDGVVSVRKVSAADARSMYHAPKATGKGKRKKFTDEAIKQALDDTTCELILCCVADAVKHERLFDNVDEIKNLDADIFNVLTLAVYDLNGVYVNLGKIRDELKKNQEKSST